MGFDLHGGVRAGGGGAADHQGDGEAQALHFLGDVDHLVQRGRDQPGESDDIDLMFAGGIENLLARLHDAEIHHIKAVALQHDADDVLADVVNVALDCCHQDLAVGFGRGVQCLFRLHVRHQVGHRLLHDAGRLDHLWQEHLAGAE